MVQLNPVSAFGARKIPVPYDGNFSPKCPYKWEAPLVYPSPQGPHIQILEPPGMHLNELFRAP